MSRYTNLITNMWKCLVLFLLVDHYVADCHNHASPTARTKYGRIEGKTIRIFNGKKVEAYLGVPYAAPPIGRNRFSAPRPPAPWHRTLRTQKVSSGCIQSLSKEAKEQTWFLYVGPESEDCLYLNVWKPRHCGRRKLPVMVWIHGGAYLGGSASMPLYDGSILAAENDVVVVSMNYRLGIFGFLTSNSSEVPGNAGLKDQIMAIRWVSENIHNFGGDPEKVTIFGESVGGTCVGFHLANSEVSKLFRYAILQSGSLFQRSLTISEADALKNSRRIAGKAGCVDNNTDKLLKCLRGKPTKDLIQANFGVPPYYKVDVGLIPVRNGKEVPYDPVSAIPESKRKNIMGLNIPMEASVGTPLLFPDKQFNEDFAVNESDFRGLLENYFRLKDGGLQDIVLHEYRDFEAPYNGSQLRVPALNTVSDYLLICPVIYFTKAWASKKNLAFYMYFGQRPSKPIRYAFPEWVGPSHGDEIPYQFGIPVDPKNGYTKADAQLSKKMMKYWTNFARYGNPNGPSGNNWKPVEPNSPFTYLVIKDGMEKQQQFLKERECDFWDNIYPDLQSLQAQLTTK